MPETPNSKQVPIKTRPRRRATMKTRSKPIENMQLKPSIKTLCLGAVMLCASVSAQAQDLLARQAPVDRKMKAVDTLAIRHLIIKEDMEDPASALYDDWENNTTHKHAEIPENFRIDLRNFCMPTPSRVVTSNYGYRARWGRQHKGLDIKVYIGDTIRAAFSGKVRIVKYNGGGYGKYVVIRHPNGLETLYGHLSKQLVEENEVVKAGTPIGLGGNTGRSTGSHLHFETRLGGVALNPALLFDFRNQDVTGDYYVYNSKTYKEESAEASNQRGKVGNGGYTPEMVRGTKSPVQESIETASDGMEKLYHKVAAGETITSIAKRRGVSVEQICRLNHLSRSSKVKPGMILRYS